MKKKRRETGIQNKGRKWKTDGTHSRRINLWQTYRTKSPCQAPCVTTVTSSLIISVNTSAKQGKYWANAGRKDCRKSCKLHCWLLLALNELKVSQPFWFKSQIKPIILKRSELQWTPADKTFALFWSAPQNHMGGASDGEAGASQLLGRDLGSQGPVGTNESCSQPVHCQGDQQLFLPAHTQLLLSFFCHQRLRVVKLKAITCKNLPLAPWLLPQRCESLRRPNPLLPLLHPGQQGSRGAGQGSGCCTPAHTVATAVSPAAATSATTSANTLLCVFPGRTPPVQFGNHILYTMKFFFSKTKLSKDAKSDNHPALRKP